MARELASLIPDVALSEQFAPEHDDYFRAQHDELKSVTGDPGLAEVR
jgi:hypothetical protein